MVNTLTLPRLLRRLLVGIPLAALLVGAMTTGVAAASGSSRQPLPPPADGSVICPGGFTELGSVTQYNEYLTTTYLADGTTVYFVSGVFRITVTNATTGSSAKVNLSGNGTTTVYADGTGTFVGHGPNELPQWTASFGLPFLAMVDGTVQWKWNASFEVTSFSYTGHVTDLCAVVS